MGQWQCILKQNSSTWPTGIATISIKILEFNFGKPIFDNSKQDKIIIVGIGLSTPAQKHHPSFLLSPPLNQQTVQAPRFQAISHYILVFQDQNPPPKSQLFQWTPKILKFLSLIPSYYSKVTKFLGKISQFEFLAMTEKNIFVYKLFLSLNISDFDLFLCENCNPT